MDNKIVKFTTDNGLEVQITPADIKQTLCPSANDKEIALFLELCRAQRLNPFIKDAYLVKYGNSPAQIITGKEVFSKRANANKHYQGYEAGITYLDKQGNVCQREGSAVYKAAGEVLVGGWCRVFIDGRKPAYSEVSLEEYSTGKSLWASKPATMVRKVAYVQCLREAFPDDFQGLYDASEMGEPIAPSTPKPKPKPVEQQPEAEPDVIDAVAVEVASDEKMHSIFTLCETFGKLRGQDGAAAYRALINSKTLIDAGAEPGKELTAEQADLASKVISNWLDKAYKAADAAPADAQMADEDIEF